MSRLSKILLLLMLLAVLVLGGSILYGRFSPPDMAQPPDGGGTDAAPDFSVLDAQGNKVSLSSLAGRPVVLNFWATWCGYCLEEMPAFESAYRDYGERVSFMLVNLTDGRRETMEDAAAYIAAQGYTFPVYYDTAQEAAYAYGLSSIPVTCFIDAEGRLVSGGPGALSEKALRAGIESILP